MPNCMSGTEDYNKPPNIKQWETTPMSAATRAECNEIGRRQYVASMTKVFAEVIDEGLKYLVHEKNTELLHELSQTEEADDDQSQDS